MEFVKDAIATTEDAIGNLMQLIGRLDYELDVLVDKKETQANSQRLAKVAAYRVACRDFMHDIDSFNSKTDKFKVEIDG